MLAAARLTCPLNAPSLLPGMALRYSAARLLQLNNHSTPLCISVIKNHKLLKRTRYIHRGSGRKFVYFHTGHSIPVLWSAERTPTFRLRHHNNTDERAPCLQALAMTPESILTTQSNMKLTLFNTRSLNNKSHILNEFILDNKLDFLCLTETWQQPLDYLSLNLTTPNGYSYINKPRSEGRGGGIAVIHRQDIKTSLIPISSAPSFEHLAFKLSGHTQSVLAVVYRPPKPNPSFLSDFSEFLTQLCSLSTSVLLLGDFNIHMDSTDSTITTDFTDMLDCFNLIQHVNFPTHNRGHILDLVCSTGLNLHHLSGSDLFLSDHLAITMTINIPTPPPKQKRKINFRKLSSVSATSLSSSLSEKISTTPFVDLHSPSDLTDYYNNILSSCLDQLAPIKTKTVSFTHSAPWFTPELRLMKTRARQLERLRNKTSLTIHSQTYKDHLQQYKDALFHARTTYYSQLIHSGSGNPKTLFSTINKLLSPLDTTTQSFTVDKCSSFLKFFQSKIDNIYSSLTTTTPALPQATCPPLSCQPLSQFSPVSPTDLSDLLTGMKTATCTLDPIPSSFVKACLPTLSSLITTAINSSLSSGTVPPSLKIAAITPILKKPGLNPDNPNNFRPISNLPFLSKVLERAVASQLKHHLSANNLYETFQSGFRSNHSTETALLKMTNDLLLSSDAGNLNILILLDLSAAFDTINHSILLTRLETTFNITGTALSWFTSYLSDRNQFIYINNCKSLTAPLPQGVPQGSVLGPLLFILYLLPLGHIIRRHGLQFHCFADDIQLLISTKSISTATHSILTNCITEIKSWLQLNFLKLNCDKSEIIIIGQKKLTTPIHNFTLNIDGFPVQTSPHIRNLGIIFDQTLSYNRYIKQITKTAFFHLKNIARLRPSLSPTAAETLIHAFITSRLDYCNSLLYGSPAKILNKLQYIQNSAARLLTHTRIREHITPVLIKLHWLPIPQRIQYKILLMTYKALHNLAPSYLTDLLHRHTPTRSLRSATANLLSLPIRTNLKSWGDRAFSVAAPILWNSLPQSIRDSSSLTCLLYTSPSPRDS